MSWIKLEDRKPINDKKVILSDGEYVEKGFYDGSEFYIYNNGNYCEGGHGSNYLCKDSKSKYFDSYENYAIPTYWRCLPKPPKEEQTK